MITKNLKRDYFKIHVMAICAILLAILVACSEDEPKKPEGIKDPDNNFMETISIKFDNEYQIFSNPYIKAFLKVLPKELTIHSEFQSKWSEGSYVYLGKTENISLVNSIPNDGWLESEEKIPFDGSNQIAPGDTFILQFAIANDNYEEYAFAKIRVTDYTYDGSLSEKNISGVIAEIECPFVVPVKIQSDKIEVDYEMTETKVAFDYPTSASVISKPEWIDVSFGPNYVYLTCYPNLDDEVRQGEVNIGNDKGSVAIKVNQKGAKKPYFGGGRGTAEDPYQIKTAQHLDNIRWARGSFYYVQTADIDLADFIENNGGSWIPISNFTGTYDGQFKEISNLKINLKNEPGYPKSALFAQARSATFKNMLIHNVEIHPLGDTAVICADAIGTTVTKCKVYGGGRISPDRLTGHYNKCAWIVIGEDSKVSECESGIDISFGGGSFYGISDGIVENCCVHGNLTLAYDVPSITVYGLGNLCINSYTTGEYTGSYALAGMTQTYEIPYGELFCNNSSSGCFSLVTNTEAQLKTKSTYVGWDFENIWIIDEGVTYPRLRCFENSGRD